jgi:hypothetical protein
VSCFQGQLERIVKGNSREWPCAAAHVDTPKVAQAARVLIRRMARAGLDGGAIPSMLQPVRLPFRGSK